MRSHPYASRCFFGTEKGHVQRPWGRSVVWVGLLSLEQRDGGDGSETRKGEHWAFQPAVEVPCPLV